MKYMILLIFLSTNLVSAQEAWSINTIDNSSNGADGVKLADINNDGFQDIVTGWEESGISKLYLHPGKKMAKKPWPVVTVGSTPVVEDAVFADMNDDGRLDVVSSTENGQEKILVHFNKGGDLLQPDNWDQQVLPASDGLMMWMYAEPLQIDGKNGMDLIAAGKKENAAIGWFEAPENPDDLNGWKWHEIYPVGWVMSIFKRDMDNDGDIDVIISDRRGDIQGCRWLENPGTGDVQTKPWQNHFIGAENKDVMFMDIVDLEGDGVEEVVVCERKTQTILIYHRSNSKGTKWEETVIKIPETTGLAKSVKGGDMDGDGIKDLVLSTFSNETNLNCLVWLSGKNLKDTQIQDWNAISGKHKSKYDEIVLLDVDEDSDLDIVICEENYGEDSEGLGLIWYENPLVK